VRCEKAPDKTTLMVELGHGLVVIRDVLAKVCVLCGADWIQMEVISFKAGLAH